MRPKQLAVRLVFVVAAGPGFLFWFTRFRRSQSRQPTVEPWFADVTDNVGIKFVHDAGPVGDFFHAPTSRFRRGDVRFQSRRTTGYLPASEWRPQARRIASINKCRTVNSKT